MEQDEGLIIDTSFDMRSDAGGKDPDTSSPTLRRCHRLLWSKPLPDGRPFELIQTRPRAYLYHRSDLGEFVLGSDSLVHSFKGWDFMHPILTEIGDEEVEAFRDVAYTIGGFGVFPGNTIEGKPTINGVRGLNRRRLADRIDLTLECIRRYYDGDLETPLGSTLSRYDDFFQLFGDFPAYAEFFLLDDVVNEANGTVQFFLPFKDFGCPAYPEDAAAYRRYRDASVEFVRARNERIDRWAQQHLHPDGAR